MKLLAIAAFDAYQHYGYRQGNTLGPVTTGGGTIRGDTPIVVEMCEMPTVINLNKDDFQSKTILDIHGIAPSICAGEGGNKLKVVYPMVQKMGCKGETYDERSEVPPLDSADSKHPVVVCYGISAYESNAMKSKNPHSGIYEAKTSRTLDLNGGNPACNQGGVLVVAYQGQTCDTNTKRAYTLLNGRVDTHNITSVCYKSAGFVGRQGAKAGGRLK